MNPQLMALLSAMQNNPNADSGGPILGGQQDSDPNGENEAVSDQDEAQSLLGPHATHLPGLLANLNALTNPGTYNTRHPLTLMKQIHPGLISQPTKSGGAFGPVDQAAVQRSAILSRLGQ